MRKIPHLFMKNQLGFLDVTMATHLGDQEAEASLTALCLLDSSSLIMNTTHSWGLSLQMLFLTMPYPGQKSDPNGQLSSITSSCHTHTKLNNGCQWPKYGIFDVNICIDLDFILHSGKWFENSYSKCLSNSKTAFSLYVFLYHILHRLSRKPLSPAGWRQKLFSMGDRRLHHS